ncbi:MAG: MFS transporter, partial [Cyclobacteriaceae bacterium]
MALLSAKPRLSFWQIWNMSFGFFGIQFGWALQLANVSRIFETLGAEIGEIAILWIAAPVTGLLVQPIIGHMSDKTWTRLGRRRPYFLVGAILASIALFIMPNSPALWVAAGMLWIMDASINISMEPFRAFVGDMLPKDQRTMGYAMQSFFIGFGSVIASVLPFVLTNWLGVPNTADAGEIPMSLKISFYVGGIAFLLAVVWTVIRTKEYSPEQMEVFHQEEEGGQPLRVEHEEENMIRAITFFKQGPIWIAVGAILTVLISTYSSHREPLVLSIGMIIFGILIIISGILTRLGKRNSGFLEVFNDLFKMPDTMKQLAWVQFFSWFGLFSMFLYTTGAVTSYTYGSTDPTSTVYQEGADWVGILFGMYNFMAMFFAFALPPLAKRSSRKTAHMISLIAGGLGLISFYFISNPNLLLISMVGIGLAWAAILSMPYAMLTSAIPTRKFGIYMGIFNFFIVLPEIVASSIYGYLLETFFDNQSIYVLIAGGISLFIAA